MARSYFDVYLDINEVISIIEIKINVQQASHSLKKIRYEKNINSSKLEVKFIQ